MIELPHLNTATKGGRRDMNTVFVIGAGANVEIGMPSGKELKEHIEEILNFDSIFEKRRQKSSDVFFAMRNIFQTDQQTKDIASRIKEAMPISISIDNYIDAHRLDYGIADAGKIAIVATIIAAEKNSYLFKKDRFKEELTKSWYPLFFQKITEHCEINQFIERLKNISFIIFNYDRCFEDFMIHALDAYYKIGKESAINLVNRMNIIHPYGIVGNLDKISLGYDINSSHLRGLSQNIRTFAEESEETKKERTAIKQLIDKANRIIFLGFAYHQMNLDLLFDINKPIPNSAISMPVNNIECFGTGFGISENDRKYIQSLLWRIDSRLEHSDISSDSCTDFFNNFWYRISFIDDGIGGS
jgi:hypothetical protein